MSDQTTQRPNVPRGGSMPAGLEEPPRIHPPNLPELPQVPQTYDPRVSVQLERAARDRAAGKPGTAAREDADRAIIENLSGLPPAPRVVEEGGFERETPVTFSQHFASYNAGETAAFTEDEAARLADLGVTGEGGGGTPPTNPPVNVDVPHVSQAADVLTCTMGNWDGTPKTYAYQWQLDGTDAGTNTATYTRQPADVGRSATCFVTATNDLGSTTAPLSNAVVIT